jgi:hypothetical protein
MHLLVEDDVTTNPVDIRFLSAAAVMTRPYEVPHLLEELGLGTQSGFWKRNDALWLLSSDWL